MRTKLVVVFCSLMLVLSCKQNKQEANVIDLDSVDLSDRGRVLNEIDTIGQGIPIFYNMYLSVELSSMFETAGAVFEKDMLNSSDRTSEYITSNKRAMNLGVYAVDLSYCRSFEQFEVAGRYFSSMRSLSQNLGIPQDYFENTAQRFEKNMTNKDSLIAIANEIYYETEEFLKENERFATASVIIMGGWVEALFIGATVALDSQNPDIIERIVDQKYSLNNLILLLKDYEDNKEIAEYIHSLKDLREILYELKVEIPANFDLNDAEAKKALDSWLSEVEKIKKNVSEIRNSIIE